MLTEEKTRSNAEKMRDKILELIEEGEKLTIQEKRWVLEEVSDLSKHRRMMWCLALVKRMWFAILVNTKKLCGISAELFCPFTKPRISSIKIPYVPSFFCCRSL